MTKYGSFFLSVYVYLHHLLSIPLLPLMTLPIYIPSSPRPFRLWSKLNIIVSSEDGALYEQVFQHIFNKFSYLAKKGVLGHLETGDYFLIRFEKMIVVIYIVESGVGYSNIVIKGLELQEPTSCHNVEASIIDEVIKNYYPENSERKKYNDYFYHTLSPLRQINIKSYSLSTISLAGIITTKDFRLLVQHCCSILLTYHFVKKEQINDIKTDIYEGGIYKTLSLYFHEDFKNYLNGKTNDISFL